MIVEINGFELNYEVAGGGEPLLWLHGFDGRRARLEETSSKISPPGFSLIAPSRCSVGGMRRASVSVTGNLVCSDLPRSP